MQSNIFGDNCCYGDEFVDCYECEGGDFFTSKSYMMTRPVTHNVIADQSLWHDFVLSKKGCHGGAFQIITYYQKSICSEKTTKYFFPQFKCSLKVLGDDQALDANGFCKEGRDIRAEWLGLPSDFRGRFTINPEQRQAGVVFEYNQDLKRFSDSDLFKRFWVSIAVPLVVVENSLNVCQYDIANPYQGNDGPSDIVQALCQPCWEYSKIGGKFSRFNAAPIRIKFGSAFLDNGNDQLVYYSTLFIPAGQQDENRYLFEPVVGYNGHFGFGTGVNFQFVLNRKSEFIDVCFFLNLEGVFLTRNWHRRTFDLKGRCCNYFNRCCYTDPEVPCAEDDTVRSCFLDGCGCCCYSKGTCCENRRRNWSRYLLFTQKGAIPGMTVPGVNILTKRVKVRPYNMVDFSMGWRVKSERYEFELGYNIWGHGEERIECIKRFDREWGIAGKVQDGDLMARSASLSTISECRALEKEKCPDDFVFITIRESDLDLNSAASQGALNHTIHAAGGFEYIGCKLAVFFGAGAYYEFPQKNSALKTWGMWFKLGGSF